MAIRIKIRRALLAMRSRTGTKVVVGCAALLLGVQFFGEANSTPAVERTAQGAPALGYDLAPLIASDAMAIPAAAPAPAPAPLPRTDFVLKRVLPIEQPFRHGEWVWDESGAPAGPIVVTVDLAAQVLSVFRDGYEIGAAVILYGADEKPTPLGAFPISQKKARHVSNLYNAPMPYMLRLTNDGVAIHGADVRLGAATHGCVSVPTAFAAKLFAAAKVGDVVIVTNGKRLALGDRIVRS